jgi:Leucine-rich repeat (LRR) protein
MKSKIVTSKPINKQILHLDSEDLPDIQEIFEQFEITSIQISQSTGYKLDDVNWLQRVGDKVVYLIILPHSGKKFDFSGLKFCNNLETLLVENYKRSIVDVSQNTKLKTLSITDSDYLQGLENLTVIESLVLDKPSNLFFSSEFLKSEKSTLNYLCVSKPKVQFDIRVFIKQQIKSIFFYQCKDLDINGIEELKLEKIKFDKCTNVKGVHSLQKCTTVKELKVIDSFTLDSIHFIDSMPELKILVVLGKSYFIDGNLNIAVSRLTHFGFDNKRHYSLKYEDFLSLKE